MKAAAELQTHCPESCSKSCFKLFQHTPWNAAYKPSLRLGTHKYFSPV